MADLSTGGSCGGREANVRACGASIVLSIAFGALMLAFVVLSHTPTGSSQLAVLDDTDELSQRERLVEDRAGFDAEAKKLDQQNRRFREATRLSVQTSLQLKDWDGALDRAARLIHRREPVQLNRRNRRIRPRSNHDSIETRQAELSHLEFVRELIDKIGTASPEADGAFSARLAEARIALDQQLVLQLDPPREESFFGWDSALPDVDWWWEGVPEAQNYINSDDRYSRHGWRVGIAVTDDDQPVFLEPPQAYSPELPRSKKLLFLLAEIERLDRSSKHNDAAAALLLRARLMRRLYGPQRDVDWRSNEFYYRYDRRPSFVTRHSLPGVKENWELADDEARTNIRERTRVITLPETQSPLALLKRLERDYPQSDSVAEALHERGLYYQSRRQFAQGIDEYHQEIDRFPAHPLAEKAKAQIARIEHADVILGQTGKVTSSEFGMRGSIFRDTESGSKSLTARLVGQRLCNQNDGGSHPSRLGLLAHGCI